MSETSFTYRSYDDNTVLKILFCSVHICLNLLQLEGRSVGGDEPPSRSGPGCSRTSGEQWGRGSMKSIVGVGPIPSVPRTR